MYKITFDTDTSRWTIQLLKYGFLWVPLSEARKTQSWINYDDAMAYVDHVGLSKVYRNYHDSPTHQIMAGAQPYYPPQVLRTKRA